MADRGPTSGANYSEIGPAGQGDSGGRQSFLLTLGDDVISRPQGSYGRCRAKTSVPGFCRPSYHEDMQTAQRQVTSTRIICAALLIGAIRIGFAVASAADNIVFKHDDKTTRLTGKAVVTAADGGLMVMTPDGVLWTVPPDELVEHSHDEQPFAPLTAEALGKKLTAELPGFEIHNTVHYLICYNTSKAYAQWCGALFERLYLGFTTFFEHHGFKLHAPEMPLVVLIFADREGYARYTADELGSNARNVVGFYSLRSNRVNMYDLTGVELLRSGGEKRGNLAQINQILSHPEAESMVATVIHEATHQIAFNCGLEQRFADVPLWLSEGLAMYFETPDLSNSKGWRTLGEVNRPRLARFREYLSRRPANSLMSLIVEDTRLRDPRQSLDAYAEAWALTYFLFRQHAKEYQAFTELQSAKGPMVWDEPAQRLKEFQQCFGNDLPALDAEFLRYMQRVK